MFSFAEESALKASPGFHSPGPRAQPCDVTCGHWLPGSPRGSNLPFPGLRLQPATTSHAGIAGSLHDRRMTKYSFPLPVLQNVPTGELMRSGVLTPVQLPVLQNRSPASPISGPAQKHSRYPGWLRKNVSTPEHILDILGLGRSGNTGSSVELENLAKPSRNSVEVKGASSRAARKGDKRLRKLEWLAEQEEMKFSHSIQFNAVPDWSSNYIAYSNLKKL
jgi:hypothetical protein